MNVLQQANAKRVRVAYSAAHSVSDPPTDDVDDDDGFDDGIDDSEAITDDLPIPLPWSDEPGEPVGILPGLSL